MSAPPGGARAIMLKLQTGNVPIKTGIQETIVTIVFLQTPLVWAILITVADLLLLIIPRVKDTQDNLAATDQPRLIILSVTGLLVTPVEDALQVIRLHSTIRNVMLTVDMLAMKPLFIIQNVMEKATKDVFLSICMIILSAMRMQKEHAPIILMMLPVIATGLIAPITHRLMWRVKNGIAARGTIGRMTAHQN